MGSRQPFHDGVVNRNGTRDQCLPDVVEDADVRVRERGDGAGFTLEAHAAIVGRDGISQEPTSGWLYSSSRRASAERSQSRRIFAVIPGPRTSPAWAGTRVERPSGCRRKWWLRPRPDHLETNSCKRRGQLDAGEARQAHHDATRGSLDSVYTKCVFE